MSIRRRTVMINTISAQSFFLIPDVSNGKNFSGKIVGNHSPIQIIKATNSGQATVQNTVMLPDKDRTE